MYAKLFSRITESSLMEEPMNVRYVFMMLLAIADQVGDVVGTDVAISRRINVNVSEFQGCVDALMQPDPNSNSQEQEGRRVVSCESQRGYHLVNYLTYRGLKTVEDRREYMRNYMAERRRKQSVNTCKQASTVLTHAEAEEDTESEAGGKTGVLPLKSKARGSMEEVVAYVTGHGNLPSTDGEWFYDKMLASGWKNDGKDVKDWKATVRTWKSISIFPSQKPTTRAKGFSYIP